MKNNNSPENLEKALERLNNILSISAEKIKKALIKREENIEFIKSKIERLRLENQELKRKMLEDDSHNRNNIFEDKLRK